MKADKHFTYIVRCKDESLYTGYTVDLQRRLKQHNTGRGAKYTRGRTPVELVYYEEFTSASDAMKRECVIKELSHKSKLNLINSSINLMNVA